MTTTTTMTNTELLRSIVQALCRHRKLVTITCSGDYADAFVIRTMRDDIGKIVGKQGKHINWIKAVFALIGGRDGRPIRVILDEPHAVAPPHGEHGCGSGLDDSQIAELAASVLSRFLPIEFAIEHTSTAATLAITVALTAEPDAALLPLLEGMKSLWGAIGKANNDRTVALDFV